MTYICPMHPQITQEEPGSCSICGMALESKLPTSEESQELKLMTLRFWICLALAVAIFFINKFIKNFLYRINQKLHIPERRQNASIMPEGHSSRLWAGKRCRSCPDYSGPAPTNQYLRQVFQRTNDAK